MKSVARSDQRRPKQETSGGGSDGKTTEGMDGTMNEAGPALEGGTGMEQGVLAFKRTLDLLTRIQEEQTPFANSLIRNNEFEDRDSL